MSLSKNLIVGGLVAILGACSESTSTENQPSKHTPTAPSQEKKSTSKLTWPPSFYTEQEKNPNAAQENRTAYEIVYFYDKNLIEKKDEGVDVDPKLSELCQKYGYNLFMVASNWEKAKKDLNLGDKSVILICNYDKDKKMNEIERFPIEDQKGLPSRLEQELKYHVKKEGTPPAGCKDYQKK